MSAALFKFERPPEAPTFHPTPAEFQDPLGYINKIRPVAESYGICKIKPPQGWSPPFSLDRDTVTFVPRVQKINELEARTRLKLNFLDNITKFWGLQGVLLRVPFFHQAQGPPKPLDLWSLYQLVTATEFKNSKYVEKKKWSMLARRLGLPSCGKLSAGPLLQDLYLKYLVPFISFKKGEKEEEGPSGDKVMEKSVRCSSCGGIGILSGNKAKVLEDPEKWNCGGCLPGKMAELCGAFTSEFGFQDSDKRYTLREFWEKGEQFKRAHFEVPEGENVSSEVCEAEYWRLAGEVDCGVTVEYGADLSVMEIGSGFPRGEGDFYGGHPWNLNNLPGGKGSVFRWIKEEISGMKVPWIYVGMCFSTFCWHNEDHWTYSVSYLHWGEVKTWYGVAGKDAGRFEGVVRGLSGELWGERGDLLDGLVTSVNPNVLMEKGVEVWRVDQGRGEFVVTFPRAYHQGFNQGGNVAEAVNFAGGEWLGRGREAVEVYRARGKMAVFCHDELVVRMARGDEEMGMECSVEVWREMGRLIEGEVEGRRGLEGLKWEGEKVEECGACKGMIWVSGVEGDGGEWRCLKCWREEGKGMEGGGIFRERCSLEELEGIREGVGRRVRRYLGWKKRMEGIVRGKKGSGVGVEELRGLVEEAREGEYPEEGGWRRKGEELWGRVERVRRGIKEVVGGGGRYFGCTIDVLEDLVGEMEGIKGVEDWWERRQVEERLEGARKLREGMRRMMNGREGGGEWREVVEGMLREAKEGQVGFMEIFQLQKKLEERIFKGIFGEKVGGEEEDMEVEVGEEDGFSQAA